MSMQPIPNNELFDKFNAGWTVRRKGWDSKLQLNRDGGNVAATLQEALYCDDWEGEPPKPVLRPFFIHQTFWTARDILFHRPGQNLRMRREQWDKKDDSCLLLTEAKTLVWERVAPAQAVSLYDINATDWEVWG